MKKNLWLLLTLLVTVALVLAACGGGQPAEQPKEEPAAEEPAAEEPAAEAPAATEEPAAEAPAATEEPAAEAPAVEAAFAVMPGGSLEKALAGEYQGTTVTVDGPFTNPDDLFFAESMKA
ncbi:MAG: hypothetical protein AB1801_01490, partial [Chloroflexota bacterium]